VFAVAEEEGLVVGVGVVDAGDENIETIECDAVWQLLR
jgi:hypothetical protein